ncbi:hypothetical protein Ssi02_12110 [Sinosporangium siamense]|uniref:Uncharacterized protein n=1 Tax=Sinosporangium siamense TaxID=1367973 RepID=A0A919RDW1_9ACTN|nr:hypothetical protein Ssi02_12110 [Sinosporangium siamense]
MTVKRYGTAGLLSFTLPDADKCVILAYGPPGHAIGLSCSTLSPDGAGGSFTLIPGGLPTSRGLISPVRRSEISVKSLSKVTDRSTYGRRSGGSIVGRPTIAL